MVVDELYDNCLLFELTILTSLLHIVEFALLQRNDSTRTTEISRHRPAREHSIHIIIITQSSSIYAADYYIEVAYR